MGKHSGKDEILGGDGDAHRDNSHIEDRPLPQEPDGDDLIQITDTGAGTPDEIQHKP